MSSWRELRDCSFGDTPALADELLALVLAGRKTATCSAARDGKQTEVGRRWVVRDGAGRPRVVIETTEITPRGGGPPGGGAPPPLHPPAPLERG